MADNWYTGNAADDAPAHRGWLLGQFMDPGDVRHSSDVEIKWGTHPAGDARPGGWASDEQCSTAVLLVSGRHKIELSSGGGAVLARQGDYLVWGPGVDHTWEAEEDSVVITIRWPSAPR